MRSGGVPDRDPLPRYLAPVPRSIEDLGLQLAWVVVAINLVGTAFGFYWYGVELGQLPETPYYMWPWVPDSPMATLLIALAIACWKLGYEQPWLTSLAFFGNIILGLWTPFVLVLFADAYAGLHPLLFQFLFWSHLAMVVQALVLYRISDVPIWGVGVASAWYGSNLLVDYFVPLGGDLNHTVIPVARNTVMHFGADALSLVAAAEVTFTLLALFLALSIRAKKCEIAAARES